MKHQARLKRISRCIQRVYLISKRCTKTFQVHLPHDSKNLFVFHLYPRFTPKTIFQVSYNKSSSFWYRILFSVYTHILELSGKNADSTLWKSYRSGRVSEDLNRESKAITLYLIKVQSTYVLKFKKNYQRIQLLFSVCDHMNWR